MAGKDRIGARRRRAMVARHARPANWRGLFQVATTLIPLVLLWWLALHGVREAWWLAALAIVGLVFFNIRVFALLHECGHGSLCRSRWLNSSAGFLFGVVSGMPQYVWSRHHDFHHRTNGDWERYRGPLTTLACDEYDALSVKARSRYRRLRHISIAPLGGFIYLIFNPRFTLMKGSFAFVGHLLRGRRAADFQTRYWKNAPEYWHMVSNNAALLGLWALMCWIVDPAHFFIIYLLSVSIAGGAGIVLFTVQHNFEHAYASKTADWCHDTGALEGTSFLILPAWLNWFTANIAYHHVHHISAAIPNYCLVRCHEENEALFKDVRRVRLSQIPASLKCILWDRRSDRIVSIVEYERQRLVRETQASSGASHASIGR